MRLTVRSRVRISGAECSAARRQWTAIGGMQAACACEGGAAPLEQGKGRRRRRKGCWTNAFIGMLEVVVCYSFKD